MLPSSLLYGLCLCFLLSGGADLASGTRHLLEKTRASAGLTNQEGYVHSNGMWTTYATKAPKHEDVSFKPMKALAVANNKGTATGMKQLAKKDKTTVAASTPGGASAGYVKTSKAIAVDKSKSAPVKYTSKAAMSTPGAKYTPAAADAASSVKHEKSKVPGAAHSGCTSANGAGCSSKQLKIVPHAKYKVKDYNKWDADKAIKVAILDDAEAAANAHALCHQGPFGALALAKAITLAIFGDASSEGRAVAVGMDADAFAAAAAISKAIWGDADARGYAKALSYDGESAKATSKSVAEAIYGDALSNDFALAVAENGGDATAKSTATSKAKRGAASSLSGATSRTSDGGDAVANSKAKAKAKGGPAWTAANSVASNEGKGSASATASQDNFSWFHDDTTGVASSIASLD